ncbi:MAG TPA: BlaI/MecI/CopY family transcriptional regulator [Vicinamibacterales bacterium]|nr:BlaI/MecI/CopY family transcriptional regulator [Vicinamibacterales bacterium]
MSSQPRSIGDQELALLRFISQRGQATVAEAVEGFGQPRGLARSTVLTMMDRLRRKGHLTRRLVEHVYAYAPRTHHTTVVRQAIASFVDRTLGGSVSPFVTYLAEREELSDEELTELESLLSRLQRGRRRKR